MDNKRLLTSISYTIQREIGTFRQIELESFHPKMAVRSLVMFHIVVLMIVFSLPERRSRRNARHHIKPLITKDVDNLDCAIFLIIIVLEDFRAVLTADIRTLSIGLCRVVYFHE